MKKFLFAFVVFFVLACGSTGVFVPPGTVEAVQENMEGTCSLAITNGHMAWTKSETGDSALNCIEYDGDIYRTEADGDRLPRLVGRGTNPAINEQGRIGYVRRDMDRQCAIAVVENREVGDNCDTGSDFPQLATTSFSGKNFVFTLLKDASSSRLYHYDGIETRTYETDAFFVRVRGEEIAYTENTRDPNGSLESERGRITNLSHQQVDQFGYGTGYFDFTRTFIVYSEWENDGTGTTVGNIVLKNRVTGSASRLGRGNNPTIDVDGNNVAWQEQETVKYGPIGRPGGETILVARSPRFDSGWLYFIAPHGLGEALFRLRV